MPRTKRKNKSSKLSIQKRWCTETKTENNMDISEHNSNVAQLSSGDRIFKNLRVPMQEKSVLEQENVADTYDGPSYIKVMLTKMPRVIFSSILFVVAATSQL
ncbi:hypothetical protein TNCV_1845061 [Trichonephila clavipes]|nr:hypothetical protein TNCV_1845061 [Trichonephila clavipes]